MNERIPKLIVKPADVKTKSFWGIEHDLLKCPDCLGHLCYVKIEYGIVDEESMFQIIGNRSKRNYSLREVGFVVYCAECKCFIENYCKHFYPEDKLIFADWAFDEIDEDERAEIECCLHQFNQTGKFETRWTSTTFVQVKKALEEYERKHPIKKTK